MKDARRTRSPDQPLSARGDQQFAPPRLGAGPTVGLANAQQQTYSDPGLRGSRMLTGAGGEGHGVLCALDGNPCADKAATVDPTTGRLPAKDLTCQATTGQKQ